MSAGPCPTRGARGSRRLASVLLAVATATSPAGAAGVVTGTQFAVNESGAATLSVPVQVPRGIGGLEPQLSLQYTSGGGNGLLGIGWSLQGVSSITRCPRTLAADGVRGAVNFDADDRFCLDGQRLLKVAGTNPNAPYEVSSQRGYGVDGSEYRTERDGFSRITAVGSYAGQTAVPRGFKVETKSGLVLEYGNTRSTGEATSQVFTAWSTLVPGRLRTIQRWMVRRIADRQGNAVDFFYCAGEVLPLLASPPPADADGATSCYAVTSPEAPSHLLHYIRYTQRVDGQEGRQAVVFRYGERPDVSESFHAGVVSRQQRRLVAIQTFTGFSAPWSPGERLRSIDLAYEAHGADSGRTTVLSRLSSLTERVSATESLPPLSFTYAPDVLFPTGSPRSRARSTASCGGVVANRLSELCP